MDRDTGYSRFVEALAARGYRSTWQLGTISERMTLDCYIGGRLSPVLVQRHWGPALVLHGWDAYAPLTTSNRVEDTIKALDDQPADLISLPAETAERVTDAFNALIAVSPECRVVASGPCGKCRVCLARAALRELATEIGKGR